ncbi:MAG: class I SAM-dependent methyltransferase [Acidimicrobiia bacterium]|nr:class I SAM-dependent methyltransferase [Acidimicrobiia bacterium]
MGPIDRAARWWSEEVVPRVVEKTCGLRAIAPLRDRVAEGLYGEVLEIGFGSGLNVPHLPPSVERLLAIDPSGVGRRMAATRLAASPVPVDFVGLDGEHIPLEDASVDSALCTFTLCTIPGANRALREVRRVLKPDGQLHFLEHGLSPEASVAKWQHRLTPVQRRVAGGCHFDRAIDRLITDSGFEIVELRNHSLGRPRTPSYLYEGIARVDPAAVPESTFGAEAGAQTPSRDRWR